jgi:hypothetical protein
MLSMLREHRGGDYILEESLRVHQVSVCCVRQVKNKPLPPDLLPRSVHLAGRDTKEPFALKATNIGNREATSVSARLLISWHQLPDSAPIASARSSS